MYPRKNQFKLYVSKKLVNKERSTNPFAKMNYKQLQTIAKELFLPATAKYKLLLALIIARTNNREDIVGLIAQELRGTRELFDYKNETNFPNSLTERQNGCAPPGDYFKSDKGDNLSSVWSTMEWPTATIGNGPSQEISPAANNCSCLDPDRTTSVFQTGINCSTDQSLMQNAGAIYVQENDNVDLIEAFVAGLIQQI